MCAPHNEDVTTPPQLNGHGGHAAGTLHGLHDAVVGQEHVMITHLAVIEGWLGQLEDGTLDDAQRRRAACVVRERTEALRLDLRGLLRMLKDVTGQAEDPEQ